tara:strand:+ start:142 stop:498 length:357 start_codon:yes stop_codon:yes gene_type:complete
MKPIWKIFSVYIFVLALMLVCETAFGQVKVIQFNAEWNKANKVKWCTSKQLTDCKVLYIDIGKNTKAQEKYNVVVVPTIIIFNDGKEVKRFQADLSFEMLATRKDIQEVIDEIIMQDF